MSGKISKVLAAVAAAAALAFALACAQTDAGTTTMVKAKLAADSTVKASQINVDTKDKIVTLSGNVDSDQAKAKAVEIARGTTGVRDVVDNLTLPAPQASQNATNPPAGSSTGQTAENAPNAPLPAGDAAITAEVKSNLLADSTVGGLNISVDTKDGVVSLTGSVKNQKEKATAVQIARQTPGVRDVQDNLTVQAG